MPLANRIRTSRVQAGLTQQELAAAIGANQSTVAYWENGRSKPDSTKALQLAELLGVTAEWLLFGVTPPAPPHEIGFDPMVKDLPVRGMVQASQHNALILTEESVSYIDRPPNLSGNKSAFAVWVAGKSMEPRFRPGEILYINPAKPVQDGCYVLIELRDNSAFVKELIKQTSTKLVLRQYHPQKDLEIPIDQVKGLYRVVGNSEG